MLSNPPAIGTWPPAIQHEDEQEEGGEDGHVHTLGHACGARQLFVASHQHQGAGKGQEAHGDAHHGQPAACGESVVEALGGGAHARRQHVGGPVALVFQGLLEHLVQGRHVAFHHQLLAVADAVAHEEVFVVGHGGGQHVVLGIPGYGASGVGYRVEFQHLAAAYHAHEVVLLLCGALVLVGRGWQLHPFEEGQLADGGAAVHAVVAVVEVPGAGLLDLDERFGGPLVVVEEESREHLLGGEAAIGGLAGELGGEVFGEGLDRTHAPFVEHVHLAQLVGRLAGEGGGLSRSGERDGKEGRQSEGGDFRPQQAPEGAVAPGQEPAEAQQQHEVAEVGEDDAPGVVSHAEDRVAVGVVVALVEAVSAVAVDVVHRDVVLLTLADDVADEVHRGAGAGVGDHLEGAQCDVERQLPLRAVVVGDGARGLVGVQEHLAAASDPRGEGAAEEDGHDGGVDEQQLGAPPHLGLHDAHDGRESHQCHEGYEPPGGVDAYLGIHSFQNGAGGEHCRHQHHQCCPCFVHQVVSMNRICMTSLRGIMSDGVDEFDNGVAVGL